MDDQTQIRAQLVRQLKEIQSHIIQNALHKPNKLGSIKLLFSTHIESLEQYNLNLFE